jgi:hypothetical protein
MTQWKAVYCVNCDTTRKKIVKQSNDIKLKHTPSPPFDVVLLGAPSSVGAFFYAQNKESYTFI